MKYIYNGTVNGTDSGADPEANFSPEQLQELLRVRKKMPELFNSRGRTYTPARTHNTKTCFYIDYYVPDPEKDWRLTRKRIKLNSFKNKRERDQYAKKLCQDINTKLAEGWNPLLEDKATNGFEYLDVAIDKYALLKMQKGRADSIRAYTSFIQNFKAYLENKFPRRRLYVISFDRKMASDFLYHIYVERGNGPRTHNNYLSFLRTMWHWFVEHEYAPFNPWQGFRYEIERPKKRTFITPEDRKAISEHLKEHDPEFHFICMLGFSALIRRKEITRLRVANVNMDHGTITVGHEIAKMWETGVSTLTEELIECLEDRGIHGADPAHYLISKNGGIGPEPLNEKRISDRWARYRKELGFNKAYQWYSLRDSGIIHLIEKGLDLRQVAMQTRHKNLKSLNVYVLHAQPKGSDPIRGLGTEF